MVIQTRNWFWTRHFWNFCTFSIILACRFRCLIINYLLFNPIFILKAFVLTHSLLKIHSPIELFQFSLKMKNLQIDPTQFEMIFTKRLIFNQRWKFSTRLQIKHQNALSTHKYLWERSQYLKLIHVFIVSKVIKSVCQPFKTQTKSNLLLASKI